MREKLNLTVDEYGMPLLLANVPNAGVTTVDPNAKSGNPQHDVRSGKFGGDKPKSPTSAPAGVNPDEWNKRMDAVREAARDYNIDDTTSLGQFLSGRTERPLSEDELNSFLKDVMSARINDIVDILSAQLSGKTSGKVVINMPKNRQSQALSQLTDDDLIQISHRLNAKGFDAKKISKHILAKIKDKNRKSNLEGRLV